MQHYSAKLKDRIAALEEAASEQAQQLRDLQTYLLSSKFQTDTTVQVQDVLNRLWNF